MFAYRFFSIEPQTLRNQCTKEAVEQFVSAFGLLYPDEQLELTSDQIWQEVQSGQISSLDATLFLASCLRTCGKGVGLLRWMPEGDAEMQAFLEWLGTVLDEPNLEERLSAGIPKLTDCGTFGWIGTSHVRAWYERLRMQSMEGMRFPHSAWFASLRSAIASAVKFGTGLVVYEG